MGAHRGRPARCGLRGQGRGGQGEHDQAGHRVPQPTCRADRGPAGADRARADPVVLPAVRGSPARRGRDRAVRPELVQPCGGGARHGVLHEGGVQPVPAPVPDLRAAARGGRHPAAQVLVLGQRRRAGAPVPLPAGGPDAALEAVPMDLESITRWEDYSRAKDEMFVHTDIPEAPWYVVDSADKRRARINMIAHLLSTIDYHDVQRRLLELPHRPKSQGYVRAPMESQTFVPDHAPRCWLADRGQDCQRMAPVTPSWRPRVCGGQLPGPGRVAAAARDSLAPRSVTGLPQPSGSDSI